MSLISTVLGTINNTELGCCLMHEHLIASAAGIPQNYSDLLGKRFKERVIQKLVEAKNGGIDTIVDATTVDLGRDVNFLIEASRLTGINIITTTGWWLEAPYLLERVTSDHFTRIFIKEIKDGIADSGVKPGILKAASGMAGLTPRNEVILRAVARTHLETKLPIMLHSYAPGQVGRQQLAVLKDEGVNLNRVAVDHCDDADDLNYLIWMANQGCYLGFDRFPHSDYPLPRVKALKEIINAGYATRILLSHDWSETDLILHAKDNKLIQNPYGYLYVKKVVLPILREMNVDEGILSSILTDNPRQFFGAE